jgi:hypothetical protein
MTTQRFPSRRPDGSAEVAGIFRSSLEDSRQAIDRGVAEWHESLQGIDTSPDLASEPQIVPFDEGFRIVFQIRPGSRLWRDWAVALIGNISNHLKPDSFAGFFDVVAGRMHGASSEDSTDEG